MYQEFVDRGFIVVSLMFNDNDYETPDTDDLKSWADNYGLTSPVVADDGSAVGNRFEADGYIPSKTLLGPGAEVVVVDGDISSTTIDELLTEHGM